MSNVKKALAALALVTLCLPSAACVQTSPSDEELASMWDEAGEEIPIHRTGTTEDGWIVYESAPPES